MSKVPPAKKAAKKRASKKAASGREGARPEGVGTKRGKKGTAKEKRSRQRAAGARALTPTPAAASVSAVANPTPAANMTTPPTPQYCYPLRFPERYGELALGAELRGRLAGRPAGGGPATQTTAGKVVWVEAGDEVVAHLDSLKVRLLDSLIVASLDLECDQTGRTPLVCVFATGAGGDPAGLLLTTDELPRGNALLAARWGRVVQNVVWASLVNLLRDHAEERHVAPVGLSAGPGALKLVTAPTIPTYSATQGGGK